QALLRPARRRRHQHRALRALHLAAEPAEQLVHGRDVVQPRHVLVGAAARGEQRRGEQRQGRVLGPAHPDLPSQAGPALDDDLVHALLERRGTARYCETVTAIAPSTMRTSTIPPVPAPKASNATSSSCLVRMLASPRAPVSRLIASATTWSRTSSC